MRHCSRVVAIPYAVLLPHIGGRISLVRLHIWQRMQRTSLCLHRLSRGWIHVGYVGYSCCISDILYRRSLDILRAYLGAVTEPLQNVWMGWLWTTVATPRARRAVAGRLRTHPIDHHQPHSSRLPNREIQPGSPRDSTLDGARRDCVGGRLFTSWRGPGTSPHAPPLQARDAAVVYHTVLPRLLRLDRLGDERQHVDAPEKDVLA